MLYWGSVELGRLVPLVGGKELKMSHQYAERQKTRVLSRWSEEDETERAVRLVRLRRAEYQAWIRDAELFMAMAFAQKPWRRSQTFWRARYDQGFTPRGAVQDVLGVPLCA